MLPMWHVINTRPVERAGALTSVLQAAGYQVSELPLLALQPCLLDDLLKQQLQQIHRVSVVVVVSPTAAKLGLQYLAALNIQADVLPIQWIAVGAGTAKYLQQAGIQAHIPEIETSEGMLQLSLFNQLMQPEQKQLMLWRGYGGRQFMFDQLKQQGWQLHDTKLYRRQLPVQSQRIFTALSQQRPQVLLISSGQSWQHWQQLVQQQAFYPSVILVLGQRVLAQVKHDLAGRAETQVVLINNLQPEHVLAVLQTLDHKYANDC